MRIFVILVSLSLAAYGEEFKAYGFVIPSWNVAAGGTESFSQPNTSAYTAAANPLLSTARAETRSTFQVAQSRIGFLATTSSQLQARLEFDFIDFAKSSPTTASLPRVRRALIEYSPSTELKLRIGQDWDLFSPLAPHSYNLVGHYFESGDVGFMRSQLQFLLRKGSLEHGLAFGLPGNNNSAADGLLELALLPTMAVRESFHWSESSQVGISFLLAALRGSTSNADRYLAGGLSGFVEWVCAGKTEIHSEIYYGENTANLGLLGLSFHNAVSSTSTREAGAYITARMPVGDSAVFAGAGGAYVLNPSDLPSSYTASGTSYALSNPSTGPGIESNLTVRIGADHKVEEKFVVFAEIAWLATRHHFQAAELALKDPVAQSFVAELGGMVSF